MKKNLLSKIFGINLLNLVFFNPSRRALGRSGDPVPRGGERLKEVRVLFQQITCFSAEVFVSIQAEKTVG